GIFVVIALILFQQRLLHIHMQNSEFHCQVFLFRYYWTYVTPVLHAINDKHLPQMNQAPIILL
ncbi:hypothetical protein ACP80I_26355, partial [Escherichia coli]